MQKEDTCKRAGQIQGFVSGEGGGHSFVFKVFYSYVSKPSILLRCPGKISLSPVTGGLSSRPDGWKSELLPIHHNLEDGTVTAAGYIYSCTAKTRY